VPAAAPDIRVVASDEVSMQYTSGTTSKPKGVLLTHANYIYGGEVMAKAMRVGPDDRHLIVLPLFHAGAQLHALLPMLLSGGSVALMERFSASRFVEQAIRHEATLVALFAAPIRMLLAQPRAARDGATRLRAISYAQNITPQQFADWHERFRAPLMQIWGMTETMSLPLMQPLDLPRKPMAMGMPVLGYECRVVDEDGHEVPAGTVGELIVRGEPGISLMKGYFKNPEATARTLRNGWLWSGDQAWRDEEGYFFFVDRTKDMIKRAGENVSATEVEAVLLEHPGVAEASVVGVFDPIRDEAVAAAIVAKDRTTLTVEEITEYCRRRLSKFKVPTVVSFVPELPKTSIGKVRKDALRRQLQADMVESKPHGGV
jgi:crotonobetaine/carnitine-CoA ligase